MTRPPHLGAHVERSPPPINKLKPFSGPSSGPFSTRPANLPLIELMTTPFIHRRSRQGQDRDANAALIRLRDPEPHRYLRFRRPRARRKEFHSHRGRVSDVLTRINWTTFFAELRKFDIRAGLPRSLSRRCPSSGLTRSLKCEQSDLLRRRRPGRRAARRRVRRPVARA